MDLFENIVLSRMYGIVRKESKSEGRKEGRKLRRKEGRKGGRERMRLEET